MMENRITLNGSDLDGFEKRKLPSPGFQVEIVMIDYDGSTPARRKPQDSSNRSEGRAGNAPPSNDSVSAPQNQSKVSTNQENDDVFSDSEGEETGSSKSRPAQAASGAGPPAHLNHATTIALTHGTPQLSLSKETTQSTASNEMKIDSVGRLDSEGMSDIKAIAADASVFTFGDDDEDDESE